MKTLAGFVAITLISVAAHAQDGSRVRSTTVGSSAAAGQISTTVNNQIIVELTAADTTPANPFDLDGRTLVFTPDGHGGYSRSVESLAWEEATGGAVGDGEEIDLRTFTFGFADRSWGSFFVSRRGLITFGEPLTYSYDDIEHRHNTMREVFAKFVTAPTISPLYKPYLGGRQDHYGAMQYVSRLSDRVVVTWVTTDPNAYVHGVPPDEPSRFQVVLHADGVIRFNYKDVSLMDGIVGLFPHAGPTKGDLIESIPDMTDAALPGHLDLLEVAIYEAGTGGVIVEWVMRDDIPVPPSGTLYSYRLHLDIDEPYFDGTDEDLDFVWQIDLESDASHARGGRRLPTDADNRLALLVQDLDVSGISASVIAGAHQFDRDGWVDGDQLPPVLLELPPAAVPIIDLSRGDSGDSSRQMEIFHNRGVPDFDEIACRVIRALGDRFDILVFHNEFRLDTQETGTPGARYGGNVNVGGIGVEGGTPGPCGAKRLKFRYQNWMKSRDVLNLRARGGNRTGFESGLLLFAHEFTHVWTAYASYERNGEREPLFGNYCRCHWHPELHVSAAFPWDPTSAGPGGFMSDLIEEGAGAGRHGGFWRENADGTFTPITDYWGGGHSWLDLYMMGLAEAHEVPDTFILRNLQSVPGTDRYTGRKEIVSIDQVLAVEGPREPPAALAQKVFNVGFIYLPEPGQAPDADMVRLHAEFRDKVIEHWSHVTGRRSRITTTIPGSPNRSPSAVGTLPDLTLRVGGSAAVVGVASVFRDPDGDPLTYGAASSAPDVATAGVEGSDARVTPVSAGTAAVTLTATDSGGLSAMQRFAVEVVATTSTTFTDHPLRPGTPIRAVHFRELRERTAILIARAGLPVVGWTDPILVPGVTPVRRIHLTELRSAVDAVYNAVGGPGPAYTDAVLAAGVTSIKAAHIMELRNAIAVLESRVGSAP